MSNFDNNNQKLNIDNKLENDDYIGEEEDEKLAKYLSKEFINYSRYRIDNLKLSRLPTKIEE